MTLPIDYSTDVASPIAAIGQGYQFGAGIRNDQVQQQQQQMAQQQQLKQQQILSALASNPNATGDDYGKAMTQIPALAEPLQKAWAARNTSQQQTKLGELLQMGAAIKSGNPSVAADLLNRQADAIENTAGAPTPESQAVRAQAKLVIAHPELAYGLIHAKVATFPDAEKAAQALASLGAEGRAQDKAPAELQDAQAKAAKATTDAETAAATQPADIQKPALDNANVRSQINERTAKLGLDRDKLTSDVQTKLLELQQKNGELPEYVAKAVNEATVTAIASTQSADKMLGLAAQIEKAAGDLGGGISAKAGEAWKRAFGDQNELSRIRSEYSRIVTPAAMAAYKTVASGHTSDKDIETAMVGVPSDTASPATMASFLRGAAKLQTYSAVLENAKSEWLGANRNLGKAKADSEIDGVRVPAGTTFKQFVDSYLPRKIGQAQAAQRVNALAAKYAPAPATAAADPLPIGD